jgi:exonuclease-1
MQSNCYCADADWLQELKAQGVQFIVAPYEADAQMAYLARRNDVQLVITEDSDLLAYGCPRCVAVLQDSLQSITSVCTHQSAGCCAANAADDRHIYGWRIPAANVCSIQGWRNKCEQQ